MNEWRMGDLEIHRLIRFKMDGSMDGSMNRALDGWMDGGDGWMDRGLDDEKDRLRSDLSQSCE